jgi:hypothetical protein
MFRIGVVPELDLTENIWQYGKISDLYGRKQCLIVAYVLFAVGR